MNEENKVPVDQEQEEVKSPAQNTPSVVEDKDENVKYMTAEEYEAAKLRENLPVGIIAGVIAGIVCAVAWAAVAYFTGTIYVYLAVLIGVGVGLAIRTTGRGVTARFGIAGAVISILGCMLGLALSQVGYNASQMNIGFFPALFNFDYSELVSIVKDTFEAIDLLCYGLAAVAGFSLSFHNVKIE